MNSLDVRCMAYELIAFQWHCSLLNLVWEASANELKFEKRLIRRQKRKNI